MFEIKNMKTLINFLKDLKLAWQIILALIIFGFMFLSPTRGLGLILVTIGWYMVAAGFAGLLIADITGTYYNWKTGNKYPEKK